MADRPALPHALHLLVAGALVVLALASAASGFDDTIARAAFDPATGAFPARASAMLELVGHRLAKSAVWIVWFVVLGAAIASHRVATLAPYRRVLWATAAAIALGPLLVSVLKVVTGPRCPWDLVEFGGQWPPSDALFVRPAQAGRCFPSGHASGGYALLALYFAGAALGAARLRWAGLFLGLAAGTAFGAVRIVQGAHFLSHNLWSAAVAWAAAALVFAIAFPPQRARRTASQTRSA
jgi:membrane-associated PAP2 superfamily phosphatase